MCTRHYARGSISGLHLQRRRKKEMCVIEIWASLLSDYLANRKRLMSVDARMPAHVRLAAMSELILLLFAVFCCRCGRCSPVCRVWQCDTGKFADYVDQLVMEQHGFDVKSVTFTLYMMPPEW